MNKNIFKRSGFWIFVLFVFAFFSGSIFDSIFNDPETRAKENKLRIAQYIEDFKQIPKIETDAFCEEVVNKDIALIEDKLRNDSGMKENGLSRPVTVSDKELIGGYNEKPYESYSSVGKSVVIKKETKYIKEPFCRLALEQFLIQKGYLFYFKDGNYYFFRNPDSPSFDGQTLNAGN